MAKVSSFNPFGPGNDPGQSPPPGQFPGAPPSNARPGYQGGPPASAQPPRHGQAGPAPAGQWAPNATPQQPGRHEAPFGGGGYSPPGDPADPLARQQVPATGGASGSTITMSTPPNGILIAAAVCGALGGIVGAIGWGRWWSLLGWLLAGPVAIWLVARFVAVDTERKTATVYSRPGSTGVLWALAVALVVIGIAVTALAVGFWIGRL